MYKLIGMAFRLSNDLATLEREFYSEKSPNSVILYGIENGVLPPDVLHMSDEDKKGIYEREIPLLYKNIEKQINYCKQEIISKASCITKIDVNPIMKQFDLLVERASSDSHVTHS